MESEALRAWVCIAGALHFCQLPAMAYFRRHVLHFDDELAKLNPLTRRVFQVLGMTIVMVVTLTGVIVLSASAELTHPTRLAVGVHAFLGLLWGSRTLIQGWYSSVWPRAKRSETLVHYGLLAVFGLQTLVYSAAAAILAGGLSA